MAARICRVPGFMAMGAAADVHIPVLRYRTRGAGTDPQARMRTYPGCATGPATRERTHRHTEPQAK